MNRKMIAAFLLVALLLVGCSAATPDITRQQIVDAYEKAGYSVFSRDYDEPLEDFEIGYIQANHPDGDYIYFAIFETPEQAKAYYEEGYHPIAMGLFLSMFAGELYIPRWEVYGCYVIQYENPDFYEPFENLLQAK